MGLLKIISIEELRRFINKYKFGKYIARDELLVYLDRMAKKKLEEKLTLNERAELNEKKKRDLYERLKK